MTRRHSVRWLPIGRQRVRRAFARFAEATAAVAAIEFAIVAPTLILALICTADLGVGIFRKMQVENAAQAGAQYASTNGFAASSISSAVTNATGFSSVSATPAPVQFCGCASDTGITTVDCSATCAGGFSAATYVTVSAQASYTTILPYPIIPSSFTFTSASTVRVQ
jgi:Flp pilus assembly protein TadG